MVQLPQVVELNMIASAGGIRTERPLAKTVLAKLVQIAEPTRSICAERLRELKPNAREALQLLSVWEGKRAELALTQQLSERERSNPLTLLARNSTARATITSGASRLPSSPALYECLVARLLDLLWCRSLSTMFGCEGQSPPCETQSLRD